MMCEGIGESEMEELHGARMRYQRVTAHIMDRRYRLTSCIVFKNMRLGSAGLTMRA